MQRSLRTMSPILVLIVVLVLVGGCSDNSTNAIGTPPEAPSECGNDVRSGEETCDGTDLAGESCLSAGYDAGDLSCSSSCTWDFSGCEGSGSICGDGVAEGFELCDGSDLLGTTCSTLGLESGTPLCVDCNFDTSGCTGVGPVCGDDNAEGLEECDGIDLQQLDCQDLGFDGGILTCDTTCRLNTGDCFGTQQFCGDGRSEGLEECDGEDFNGIGCIALGFDSGSLACTDGCLLDSSSCSGTPAECGDDLLDGLEECDGTDLGGSDCTDLDFVGGILACDSSCTFDTTGCSRPECGNGISEPGEACDDDDLGGQDCQDIGLGAGLLTCNADCTYDASACQPPICGDGSVNQSSEQCDGSDLDGEACRTLTFLSGELLCSDDCTFDTLLCRGSTAVCGDDERAVSEECEGADLGGATCLTLGWDDGELACSATCVFDTSGCTGTGPECLDGVAEGDEMCDGDDLRGLTCEDLDFTGGTLVCNAQCLLSFAACIQTSVCGNDTAERLETCDGTDLRGQDCGSLDVGSGDLACADTCDAYDFTGCTLAPVCGNESIEGLEVCDGTALGGLDCSDFGYLGAEAVACYPSCMHFDLNACSGGAGRCGNGRISGTEQCDGSDFANTTCEDLGFAAGDLDCNASNCTFDALGCTP